MKRFTLLNLFSEGWNDKGSGDSDNDSNDFWDWNGENGGTLIIFDFLCHDDDDDRRKYEGSS